MKLGPATAGFQPLVFCLAGRCERLFFWTSREESDVDKIAFGLFVLATFSVGYLAGERPWEYHAEEIPIQQQAINERLIQALNSHAQSIRNHDAILQTATKRSPQTQQQPSPEATNK